METKHPLKLQYITALEAREMDMIFFHGPSIVNSSQHLVVKPHDVLLTITIALQPLAHVNHIHLKLASIWKGLDRWNTSRKKRQLMHTQAQKS